MKKFKEFYKAVSNPQTVDDWRMWWEHQLEAPTSLKYISPNHLNRLWDMCDGGSEFRPTNDGNIESFGAMSFGNFWLKFYKSSTGNYNIRPLQSHSEYLTWVDVSVPRRHAIIVRRK